MMFISSC